MVLESHVPFEEAAVAELNRQADGVSRTDLMKITLTHGDQWARVQLKQVDSAYPLQGTLQVGDGPAAEQAPVSSGPEIGDVWLGSRLAIKLGANVGDSLDIAGRELRVSHILFHEPDRLMEGHNVDFRAMVHSASLEDLALENSGRRFRYLIAAGETARQSIEDWARETMPGASIIKKIRRSTPAGRFLAADREFPGAGVCHSVFHGGCRTGYDEPQMACKTPLPAGNLCQFWHEHSHGHKHGNAGMADQFCCLGRACHRACSCISSADYQ